jgi:hypothetical protein
VNHGLDLHKFSIIIYGEPGVCFTWDGLIQARFSVFMSFMEFGVFDLDFEISNMGGMTIQLQSHNQAILPDPP